MDQVEQITSEVVLAHASEMWGDEYEVRINGATRCFIRGKERAEAEAARIVKGIEADRRWFAARAAK